jgi:hypothetical protein
VACAAGPDVSESGLVLALDGANYKSFKGEATTNLIPNPTVNAYPTTGNAWGTYNTNQYGSGTYFSIGTVNDVTNNIITMTSAHSLRTYDVMNPQTTGGGVTAGTNYFIKKVSSTSFTLHAYNGSEDGSQGYINPSTGNHKVYDSIVNDTRISVNSTSFPTMWWGYPHQPNSGLVKELRYGEFNAIPNLPANDCIRLHYIRTDDVKDGMSYNVDCTVTPSSPVTVSFYTRSANANAVGKVIQYYIYNYGASAQGYAWNFTLGAVGVWERQSFTYTPAYGTMISYWFPVTGGVYSWDWSCMQVEQKSYSTNFIAGTRGATVATGGGWADLIGNGNNGELVNGVRENSANGGSLVFDGVDDYAPLSSAVTAKTILSFVRVTASGGDYIVYGLDANGSDNWFGINGNGVHLFGTQISDVNNFQLFGTTSIQTNVWYQIGCTIDDTTAKVYLNGKEENSTTKAFTIGAWNTTPTIGRRGSIAQRYFPGNIANLQVYNRVLTAAEIQQNFNASRGRFGI